MSQTSAWDMEKALQILKGKGMNPSIIEPVCAKKIADLTKVEDCFNVIWRVPCWKFDINGSKIYYLRMDNGELLREVPNRVCFLLPENGILYKLSEKSEVYFIKRQTSGKYATINVELQYVEPGAFEGIVLPGA